MLIESKKFTREVYFGFFGPALISAIALSLSGIVDAVVIGQKLGEEGLAAIGFTFPLYMIINVIGHAMAIGTSIEYRRYLTTGKPDMAKKIFTNNFYVLVTLVIAISVLGVLFCKPLLFICGTNPNQGVVFQLAEKYTIILILGSIALYLQLFLYQMMRSDDSPQWATVGLAVGSAFDFILNFVFVIGLNMGVAGAAWSTVLGGIITVLIYLPKLYKKNSSIKFTKIKVKLSDAYNCFKIGFATSSQYVYLFITLICINQILVANLGELSVAVFDIILNISSIAIMIIGSTVDAMQPVITTFRSEKDFENSKYVAEISLISALILSMLMSLFCFFLPQYVCSVFGVADMEMAIQAVHIYSFAIIFLGINAVFSGYYQACDFEKRAYYITFIREFGFKIVFALIFGFFTIDYFWWMFSLCEFFTAIIVILRAIKRKEFFDDIAKSQMDNDKIIKFHIDDKNIKLESILHDAEVFVEKWGANFKQIYFVNMALEEICSAIIENAFTQEGNEYIHITLIYEEEFTLHIRDNANKFNPFSMKTELIAAGNEDTEKALGIMVIKKKAKSLIYKRYKKFNTLIVKI